MTNEDILDEAINIAIKKGLKTIKEDSSYFIRINNRYIDNWSFWMYRSEIIFSHDFAKAFWGTKTICTLCGSDKFNAGESFNGETTEYQPHCAKCGTEPLDILEFGLNDGTTYPSYIYHLTQMVTYQEPLKYLEQLLTPLPEGEVKE